MQEEKKEKHIDLEYFEKWINGIDTFPNDPDGYVKILCKVAYKLGWTMNAVTSIPAEAKLFPHIWREVAEKRLDTDISAKNSIGQKFDRKNE